MYYQIRILDDDEYWFDYLKLLLLFALLHSLDV